MKKFVFDKTAWIQNKNLLNKKVIFLDTFIWSKIIREEEDFVKLRELLLRLVRGGKIIVAVNISLISEVVDRADIGQAKEILGLFDELSGGVFLTNTYTLFSKELEEQIVARLKGRDVQKLDQNVTFGPIWEVLGEAHLSQYVAEGNSIDGKTASNIFRKLTQIKLIDLSEAWFYNKGVYKEESQKYLMKRYKQEMSDGSYRTILKEEQDALGRGQVGAIFSVCDKISFHVVYERLDPQDRFKEIVSKELKVVVNACPTFSVSTRLHAKLRFLKDVSKSIRVNDFYDIFHLSNAIPYCDYIICDKEMAHICKNELKLDKEFESRILTFNELDDFTEQLGK
ncbi:hypothetical protein L6255_02825 [Candidatus Parcubacteria bacterium]|nr:hypothetical protein [Candidatus Parcubacteria bacterium]